MIVALIDYGAGNLRSVANALGELGIQPRLVSSPDQLEGATHVVMPGVGSFGDCMTELAARNLIEPLRAWAAAGKPYFGICLGYQILFEGSEETPDIPGLGVLRGQVRRFQEKPGLKIPHMGWNSVVPRQPDTGFWQSLGPEPYFYYVHSYFPVPADDSIIAAETTYGDDTFAGAIQKGAILAAQFHPEKSQDAGLLLLSNFFGV
jgi:imidazole glycerol phosphate synthase glutamine amidotransferase subunit